MKSVAKRFDAKGILHVFHSDSDSYFFFGESTNKGVKLRSIYVTQVQQQRPESPTVTLTWHACKHKVHKLQQKYILKEVLFL